MPESSRRRQRGPDSSGIRKTPVREAERALDELGVARVECDPQRCVRWMNRAAERLTGWTVEQAIGHPVDRVVPLVEEDDDARADGSPRERTFLVPRSGPRVPIACATALLEHGTVLLFRELTRERAPSDEEDEAPRRDSLTGLPDRPRLDARIVDSAARGRAGLLAILEVETLELLQATCGHEAADRLLQWAAARLEESLGEGDALTRLDGGRFALLLCGRDAAGAEHRLRELRQRFGELRFGWASRRFRVETSAGAVRLPSGGPADPSALLQDAAEALARARSSGVRVVVHHGDETHLERRREALRWLGSLQEHLASGRVHLYAQPIRPLRRDREAGAHFEILMRPCDLDGNVRSPVDVIAAAEQHRLMEEIDRWVVGRTLDALATLPSRRLAQVSVCAINLSGASLGSESLLELIIDHLGRTRIPPQKICFEITETAAVGNIDAVRWLLQELRSVGCRFAIDDFGAGMSSYGYLRDLPVDYLKIDGSFVRSCVRRELDRSIVESIVHVARTLSVETVGEWADDVETAQLLRDIGVDYLQGFGFGRPAPLEELLAAPELVSTAPAELEV